MNPNKTTNKFLIWIMVAIILLCIPLGLWIFAEQQHASSLRAYEDSRKDLIATGVEFDVSKLLEPYYKLDQSALRRFITICDDITAWDELDYEFPTDISALVSLNQDHINWLKDPNKQKQYQELSGIIQQHKIPNNFFSLVALQYPNPAQISVEELLAIEMPNMSAALTLVDFITLNALLDNDLKKLIQCRSYFQQPKSLIGGLVGCVALSQIDRAILYQTWSQQLNNAPQLQIHPAESILLECLKTEIGIFGTATGQAIINQDYQKFSYGTVDTLDHYAYYMWGLHDLATTNAYYVHMLDALHGRSKAALDSHTPKFKTNLGSSFFGSYQNIADAFYQSQAHQRMCQIAMDLSAYYQRHHKLPKDLAEVQTQIPDIKDLFAGSRFSFQLTYRKVNEHSFCISIDTSHRPDSCDMSTIKTAPSSFGTSIFISEDAYIYLDCQAKDH